jgi:adenine nucleotide transporter 17
VTYPYIFAKVRIQARSADSEYNGLPAPVGHHRDKSRHPGAITILTRVLQKEGITGWYQVSAVHIPTKPDANPIHTWQGMSAQITKAVLSQALLFMSKDQFEQWAVAIMVLFAG